MEGSGKNPPFFSECKALKPDASPVLHTGLWCACWKRAMHALSGCHWVYGGGTETRKDAQRSTYIQ